MEKWDKLENVKKYYINFAHNGFVKSQEYALEKAKSFGFETKGYTMNDLEENFRIQNNSILSLNRGAGYWIWKPYIILDAFEKMNDGDFLIYMDSGAYLMKSPDDILRMINHKGVLTFSLGIHKQSTWCKGDCFVEIFGEDGRDLYKDELQIFASFVFFRKCDYSVKFVKKWLELCCRYELVTDSPSQSPNYSDFKEHRHDQSLLSLLVYKDDIMYIPDVTQWCFEHGYDIESRKIVEHHRQKI
jgi:hypothetical protein